MLSRKEIITKHIPIDTASNLTRLDLGSNYDYSKPTILIVDDFQSIIKLFKRLVKRMDLAANFNVVYSSHADAGLTVLNELYHNQDFSVSILITDITFGGSIDLGNGLNFNLDGIKLCEIVNEIFPNVLYHFITGHIVSAKSTPKFFEEFKNYSDEDLMKYVTYKDMPVSTNKNLIYNLVEGTKYEDLIK